MMFHLLTGLTELQAICAQLLPQLRLSDIKVEEILKSRSLAVRLIASVNIFTIVRNFLSSSADSLSEV